MIGNCIAFGARIFTGARPNWVGSEPSPVARVYFANHTSNLDFLLVWAALPHHLRIKTRPVAARDYWESNRMRNYLAKDVFRAVLIERKKVTRANNPLTQFFAALDQGESLIIFPEGGRTLGEEIGEFKSGLYHVANDRPAVELIPVYIENLSRVMPKGEVLPIPILCSVAFGAPISLASEEPKSVFLGRARDAVIALSMS